MSFNKIHLAMTLCCGVLPLHSALADGILENSVIEQPAETTGESVQAGLEADNAAKADNADKSADRANADNAADNAFDYAAKAEYGADAGLEASFDAYSDDAAGGDEIFDLGQSVVTAAGFAQDLREAPATMSVITAKEIEKAPARDIGDIVENLPGVEISKSKTGSSNVMIRGFSSDYTLYMVDGKRQNATSGYVMNGVDPNFGFTPPSSMIERIEVIRGPASTLYGSDAIGGAINVITKQHPDRLTGSISFDTQLQEHSEYGHAYGTNAMVAVPVIPQQLSVMLRGRYYSKNNTELLDPSGAYVAHSANDYRLENYGGRVTFSPNSNHHFSVDAEQYRMQAGSMSTSSQGMSTLQTFKKDQAILNYDGDLGWGNLNSYLQYYKHSTETDYKFYNQAYIAESRLVTPFDLSTLNSHLGLLNLTTGVQFWHDRFRDDSGINSARPVDISGHDLIHNLTSLYAEGEYFITEQWIATLGARYTYSDIFGSHTTPRAYLVFKANDEWSFKTGVAAGYKIPTAKELIQGVYQQNSQGANPRYGNPDLTPESSINYELGVMYEKPRVGSFSLTAFLTDFKNTLGYLNFDVGSTMPNGIVCDPLSSSSSAYCSLRSNVGKTRAQGVEFLFQTAKFNHFSLSGSYTYTRQVYRDGEQAGEPVNAVPRHALTSKLAYDRDNYGFFLKGVGKYNTPYVSTGKTDPGFTEYKNYFLVDIGGYYNFTPHSRLNFAINNLFDLDAFSDFDVTQSSRGVTYTPYYRDYIEGRNLYLNYTYEF